MFGGLVIHGQGVGKKLGYPTANIDCKKEQVHLGSGVYAGFAKLGNVVYEAAIVIMSNKWKVEVHLLGYGGPDFYGSHLSIHPIQRVGTLETYETSEELVEKIRSDIELVKTVLNEKGKPVDIS